MKRPNRQRASRLQRQTVEQTAQRVTALWIALLIALCPSIAESYSWVEPTAFRGYSPMLSQTFTDSMFSMMQSQVKLRAIPLDFL
jgi:hypothetical protein